MNGQIQATIFLEHSMLLIGVLGYLLLSLMIGLAAMRRVRSAQDFLTSGRNMPMALNTAALFALWYGSETMLGASGTFAMDGLQAILEDPFGAALCLFIAAAFFVRPLYRQNVATLGELYEKSYGPAFGLWASLAMTFTFFSYAAGQFVALGLVVAQVSQLSVAEGIVLCAAVVTVYTMAGGLWAVSFTDLLQGIVMVVGLGFTAWQVTALAGGPQAVLQSAAPYHFDFWPDPQPVAWLHWLGAWIIIGLGSLPSQDIFQRFNAARTEKAAILSTWLGGGLYLILALVPLYLALAALKLEIVPGSGSVAAQDILPRLISASMPPVLQILFYGALLSAILSTASGALLAPAALLSENIFPVFLKLSSTPRGHLFRVRLAVVGVAFISGFLALIERNIFHLVSLASALGLVSLFVPLCAALFTSKPSSRGAFGALCGGLGGYLVGHLPGVEYPVPPHLVGLSISFLVYQIGRLLDRILS
ncbi:MAG: sodium:solute symporter family protein [Flavobacteriales bacterium]|nr:sodium:solute symporter family protein [Flavobacteriales bacterium]